MQHSSVSKSLKFKKSNIGRTQFSIDSDVGFNLRSYYDTDTTMPPAHKARLHDLFMQIEREFEALYLENRARKLL